MQLRVSSPGLELDQDDIDRIQRDLEKLDRRLSNFEDIYVECRINNDQQTTFQVTLIVDYARNHLTAVEQRPDVGQAVRAARDDLIRQINDRSRGSHSQYAQGR